MVTLLLAPAPAWQRSCSLLLSFPGRGVLRPPSHLHLHAAELSIPNYCYIILLWSGSISLMKENEKKLKSVIFFFEFIFVFNWLTLSPFYLKGFQQ